MKTNNPVSEHYPQGVSLYKLVEDVSNKYTTTAKNNQNSFINNISNELLVNADEMILGTVLSGVVKALVYQTRESQILFSAKELYGSMIEVSVKDDNCFNTYAVALGLQDVSHLAEKIGGSIDITNRRQKITTVLFRFPVLANEN